MVASTKLAIGMKFASLILLIPGIASVSCADDAGVRKVPLNATAPEFVEGGIDGDVHIISDAEMFRFRESEIGRVSTDKDIRRLVDESLAREFEIDETPSTDLKILTTKVSAAGWQELSRLEGKRELNLKLTQIDDGILQAVGALRALRELDLSNTKIQDNDLAHLTGLEELATLNLADCNVADACLASVAQFRNLETLDLSRTRIAARSLGQLSKLNSLVSLHLEGIEIDDEALKQISNLPKLSALDLSGRRSITDRGVQSLTRLQELCYLNLDGTSITDDALKQIAKIESLSILEMNDTKITLAGLKHLKSHKGLGEVYISGTPITRPDFKAHLASNPYPFVIYCLSGNGPYDRESLYDWAQNQNRYRWNPDEHPAIKAERQKWQKIQLLLRFVLAI